VARPPHVPPPETELEEFFDFSIDPMSIIGLDGEFKRVNASFLRLLGYTKPELFSRTALDILHPDDVEPAREALAQLAQGHEPARFEARVVCADGAARWLEWSTRSVPERGAVYSVGRDTTERRRVDAELREAQGLLEASRDELHVLAEEQAALRRVATLVAQDVPPTELFDAVMREVGTLFGADFSGMIRYENDESVTTVATWAAAGEHPPVPTRWDTEPGDPAMMIVAAREATRVDDWMTVPGAIAAVIREVLEVSSSVGCPIVVEGRLWGALAVHSKQSTPLPPGTESRIAQFTDLVGTAIANAESRRRADGLAEEQAALRRVATLVAKEAPPAEVFAKVAEEAATVLGEVECVLLRDESDGTATTVAAWGAGLSARFPVGTPVPAAGDGVLAFVLREGRPRRIDDYSAVGESTGGGARDHGIGSAVGYPIVVGGGIWGAIVAAVFGAEPCPPETERHIARFADLVATAIANAESRAEVERLAAEQAALRRVATLVAQGVSSDALFSAVCEEVEALAGADASAVIRFETDGTVTLMGTRAARRHPVGARLKLDPRYVIAAVHRTGRAARFDTDDPTAPDMSEVVREERVRSALASPIVVEGALWGAITTASRERPLPVGMELRLANFTELVATAIANSESRARLRQLADEQAALGRVATLVAEGVQPDELFAAVSDEVAQLLDTDRAVVARFEHDPPANVIVGRGQNTREIAIGSRWELHDPMASAQVYSTGRSARVDGADWSAVSTPIGEPARQVGVVSAVSSPIVVEGSLWGAINVTHTEALPPETEGRLEKFTRLVATAVANAESREALKQLAAEQAGLRRVATLVAEGASPSAVLDAVAAEMERALGADATMLLRYEPDNEATVVARRAPNPRSLLPGTRVSHEGVNVTSMVRRTGRPARIGDYQRARGPVANLARAVEPNVSSAVGAPVVVDGRLWGVIIAGWSGERSPPGDTEERMAKFAQMLDTAIANADSRDQLISSRARLLTAGDEARRRVVRDLHDGAQQRLVHTIVTLKLAQQAFRDDEEKTESLLSEAVEHAEQGNRELRELAHGILPSALTHGGLHAGIDAVVGRVDLPVQVDVPAERYPVEIEASAYFIVAEALTNVVKHAHAGHAQVRASVQDGTLRVEIRDDGSGGADPDGHGLVGMRDRVTTLGGRLEIESPAGGGTIVAATLPLSAG
jgi:PAS domain S-box-containing protein